MRLRILSIFAMAIALIAGEAQAQTVVVFDNLTPTANTIFNNTTNLLVNPARYLLGEDFSTIAPANSDDTFLVESVEFNYISFGGLPATEDFINIEVEVTFWGGITPDPTLTGGDLGNQLGTDFGNATNLGSETFSLGTLTNTGSSQSNMATVNFTNGIDIGDGQNLGITFELTEELADGSRSGRSDRLAVTYCSATDVAPFVGTTTDRLFRDQAGFLGVIDSIADDFGFVNDAGLAFRINATAISGTCILGDVDMNGVVDFNDIPEFVTVLLVNMFQCEADVDQNDLVDFNDIPLFVEILLGSGSGS